MLDLRQHFALLHLQQHLDATDGSVQAVLVTCTKRVSQQQELQILPASDDCLPHSTPSNRPLLCNNCSNVTCKRLGLKYVAFRFQSFLCYFRLYVSFFLYLLHPPMFVLLLYSFYSFIYLPLFHIAQKLYPSAWEQN